ncbi:hypothetical protein BHE74_00015236 [Ensete ventricosum]|nr:hypothetical protein BHE74_00015236 [Ensete ventricosum]RZR87001.1 hypothetical protein BHM03_00014286 [Ensete ventricosum]
MKGILSASREIRNLIKEWLVEAGLSPTLGATRRALEASGKRSAEAPIDRRKKAKVPDRHKSRCEGDKPKSRVAKGKEPTETDSQGEAEVGERVVITTLDNKLDVLRKEVQRLKDGGDSGAVAAVKQRTSKAQSLKSPRFETGLVRMGRVSFEYGYQLALAWFHARYPDLEMEEDPFKLLPEDLNVSMVDEQPFDDSPLPPEE